MDGVVLALFDGGAVAGAGVVDEYVDGADRCGDLVFVGDVERQDQRGLWVLVPRPVGTAQRQAPPERGQTPSWASRVGAPSQQTTPEYET